MTRKTLTLDDHGLWDDVKRTIKPLQNRHKTAKSTAKKLNASTRAWQSVMTEPITIARPVSAMRSSIPPPLADLDRRTAQRLSRGQIEPEARLDLHGEGLETARHKLLQFLVSQRHWGNRFVLVITGKGASPFSRHTLHGISHFHAPEREGRLRREVPMWLHEEAFRLHVVGFQPSHPRHGGGGAFYVRLRRAMGHLT